MQCLFLSLVVVLLNSGWSQSGVLLVFSADTFTRHDFPPDFVFGSGVSSYQYEGAAYEDGRTPSTLDTFAHAGNIHGDNGDIACDGYHKYKEDVQLMAETGLEAFRFSISWSRLIPNGRGPVNPKGLEYYNNLIDELVRHGIQPHITLFHIDIPQALQDEYGGWISRKIVKDFTVYADVCFREFGNRVLHWTTMNEANVFALTGYDSGQLPPQRCSPPFGMNCAGGNSSSEPYIAGHIILLAHASAARLYKEKYQSRQHGFIGINILAFWYVPYSDATEDVIATQRAKDFWIGWLINPLVFGDYPEVVKMNAGTRLPTFSKLESKQVKGSFDFLGLNHYSTLYIKDSSSSLKMETRDFFADSAVTMLFGKASHTRYIVPTGERVLDIAHGNHLPLTYTQLGESAVMSSGLPRILEYFKQIYGNPPIYIHENGNMMRRNTSVNDIPRVEFLHAFIGALLDAVRNGSNARGYFTWSFLDVLEILYGYKFGFGLYYVDPDDKDLKRHPKLSAHWYSNFLKGGSISLHGDADFKKNLFAVSQSHSSQ